MLGLYFRIRSGVVRQSLWPSRYSRQLSGTRNHNNSALIFFPSLALSSYFSFPTLELSSHFSF